MRINADGTPSVVLGLVHVACVTETWAGYQNLFAGARKDQFGTPRHDPVDLQPWKSCALCQQPFYPGDRVALQGILA
jgi:hypothetical protein